MSNKPKQVGTAWETAIKRFLQEVTSLEHARRVVQTGRYDEGDLHVWPFTIQAKAVRKHNLSGWVKDARDQADRAGMPWSSVFVKKHGCGTGAGYAVRSIEEERALMAYVRTLEAGSTLEGE